MLFFLNKPDAKYLDKIPALAGDEDKNLLLVGDAVVLGTPFWEDKLEEICFDEIYLAKDAVESRNITIGDSCEKIDYSEMVYLLFETDGQVVSL